MLLAGLCQQELTMAKPTSTDPTKAPPRDPHEWKSGDEPMTSAQRAYLETLMREAGEDVPDDLNLTKAEAAVQIDEFQRRTGRGPGSAPDTH